MFGARFDPDSARDESLSNRKRKLNETPDKEQDAAESKHSSILKRFQRTLDNQDAIVESDEEPDLEPQDLKPLEPMPQPALPKDVRLHSQTQNLDWLAKPLYFSTTHRKPFKEFEPPVPQTIVDNLRERFEIKDAFSVQVQVISYLLSEMQKNTLSLERGRDILVNASTGSGKTLSYCIPIVASLLTRRVPKTRCIIVLPTRPLISQVHQVLLGLLRNIDLNVQAFRKDISIKDEAKKLQDFAPDIIISTPGRLVEHILAGDLRLEELRWLVIDEADRLLNQHFQNWCDVLISTIETQQSSEMNERNIVKLKTKCQKLIFSATLTTNSEKLTHLKLFKPQIIVINDSNELVNELYQLPSGLEESYLRLSTLMSSFKPLILFRLLTQYTPMKLDQNGLVFVKSNEAAIRLTRLLQLIAQNLEQKDLIIESVNSTMTNHQRSKALKAFEKGEIHIVVSTDLMSRGINLTTITHVVNYDLPVSTKEYVHRIGRTARAENSGLAVSFCMGEGEFKWFKKIAYSGKLINRNGKEIKHVRTTMSQDEMEDDESLSIQFSDGEKSIYERSLAQLQDQVTKSF